MLNEQHAKLLSGPDLSEIFPQQFVGPCAPQAQARPRLIFETGGQRQTLLIVIAYGNLLREFVSGLLAAHGATA
jgi:hypothetical protein